MTDPNFCLILNLKTSYVFFYSTFYFFSAYLIYFLIGFFNISCHCYTVAVPKLKKHYLLSDSLSGGSFTGSLFFIRLYLWDRILLFLAILHLLKLSIGNLLIWCFCRLLPNILLFSCRFLVVLLGLWVIIIHMNLYTESVEPSLVHVLNGCLSIFLLTEINHCMTFDVMWGLFCRRISDT